MTPTRKPARPALGGAFVKNALVATLLVSVAVFGPMVAFAGVSVIWPSSTNTATVDETPPVRFAAGTDHSQAETIGFAGTFTAANNGASYTLTLSGLSGGTVTIDDLVNVTKDAAVTSHKLIVAEALTGSLTTPTVLKVRLWSGSTAPTADADAQVCAVLDLKSALDSESAACTKSTKMQLVYQLPDASSGSSTVKLRPSSIVFA